MQALHNSDTEAGEKDSSSPRRAKWWHSTFHTVTAMVGAGVLSLPSAMAHLGWYHLATSIFITVIALKFRVGEYNYTVREEIRNNTMASAIYGDGRSLDC